MTDDNYHKINQPQYAPQWIMIQRHHYQVRQESWSKKQQQLLF